MGGTGACALVGSAESFPSDGQRHVRRCIGGFRELRTTLGSLSADGWGCVPFFLFGIKCPALEHVCTWVELGHGIKKDSLSKVIQLSSSARI